MIRQAISCDICGAEKKQTNHWFVAWEVAGELRVSGWNSRNRQRTGAKHLCGQVCMHKLADDFMARVIAQKIGSKASADEMEEAIKPSAYYSPRTSLVLVENTHNRGGGSVWPLEQLRSVASFARERADLPAERPPMLRLSSITMYRAALPCAARN